VFSAGLIDVVLNDTTPGLSFIEGFVLIVLIFCTFLAINKTDFSGLGIFVLLF